MSEIVPLKVAKRGKNKLMKISGTLIKTFKIFYCSIVFVLLLYRASAIDLR